MKQVYDYIYHDKKGYIYNDKKTAKKRFSGGNALIEAIRYKYSLNSEFGAVAKKSVCIDWLNFTFPSEDSFSSNLNKVLDKLCLIDRKYDIVTGRYGFKFARVYNENIHVNYDNKTARNASGVEVAQFQMSGRECRLFEERLSLSGLDFASEWLKLFGLVYDEAYIPTRIDLAVDLFEPIFSLDEISYKIKNREYCCKAKKANVLDSFETQYKNGYTINIGSRSSRVMLRVYDKKLERESKGFNVNVDTWIRFELQFNKGGAIEILKKLVIDKRPLQELILEALYKFIDIKENDSKVDENKSRWRTWEPWLYFLGTINKISYSNQSNLESTLTTNRKWLSKLKRLNTRVWLCEYAKGNFGLKNCKDGFMLSLVDNTLDFFKEYALTNRDTKMITNDILSEYGVCVDKTMIDSFINYLEGVKNETA